MLKTRQTVTVVYHEQLTTVKSSKISTVTILSMLQVIDVVVLYSVHDIPFQNHALFTAMNHTNYFNPGQTKVVCSDQPLYVLKKTIIWANPSTFQKSDSCYITNYDPETKITSPPIKTPYCCYTSDVFTFFGVMHIEQVSLKCTGELITVTGLEDVLGSGGLKTIGLMKSLCDVSSLKKARYGGQALGPVFHSLLVEAHQQTKGATDLSGLNTWAERQEGPMFKPFGYSRSYHEREPSC